MIRGLFLLVLTIPALAACAPYDERPDSVSVAAAVPAFISDRISVEVRGEGPDVVLIPGLSSHPQVWEETVRALPGYRYHLVHVAGFAGRPARANASGPVIEPVAAEIGRYIVEAGLERPAVIGHSLGGSWAMMVGAAHPDRVSRIMVVDMMPWLGAIFGPAASSPEALRAIAGQIRQGMTGQTEAARRAQTEATIATMVRTEGLRPGVIRQSLDSDRAVSAQAFYEVVLADLRPSLARLTMPVKVLWAYPPGAPIGVEQMAQYYTLSYSRAPNASVERIENSWHFIMFDQPERFRAELADFLRGS